MSGNLFIRLISYCTFVQSQNKNPEMSITEIRTTLSSTPPMLEDIVQGESQLANCLPKEVDKRTLIFVSDKFFQNAVEARFKNGFRCSAEEVGKIKKIMGPIAAACTIEDFGFEQNIKCTRCHRQYNFFDVFLHAVEHHGIGFLKWVIFDRLKKVQMFPKDQVQILICSNCGLRTTLQGYTHYKAGSYFCA